MGDLRYFIDTDDSCHWYMVPIDKLDEWEAWIAEICSDKDPEEIDWDEPSYAIRIDGPSSFSFSNPKDRNGNAL